MKTTITITQQEKENGNFSTVVKSNGEIDNETVIEILCDGVSAVCRTESEITQVDGIDDFAKDYLEQVLDNTDDIEKVDVSYSDD